MEQRLEGKEDSTGFAKSKMKRTLHAEGEGRARLKQWFGHSTNWDANCVWTVTRHVQ